MVQTNTEKEARDDVKARIIANSNKETKIKATQFVGSPFRGEKWEVLKAKIKAQEEG